MNSSNNNSILVTYLTSFDSPIGRLFIEEKDNSIIGIVTDNDVNFENKILLETPLIRETRKQLQEYFIGKRKVFDIPIKITGTPFMKSVWNVLYNIPYGETLTYGEIAKLMGNPKGARAIGKACNKNKIMIVIPCHRVIGKNKQLVGFSCGLEKKQILLELEKNK